MIYKQQNVCDNSLRRIASNSLLLFVRMLAVMIVNLYAVRLVLKGLGVESYGIYNTVAGLVGLSTFLNGVLDVAIQRFYSFFMGKGDMRKVKETFTISLKIVIILSVAIVVLFETAGIWAVDNYIVFPIEKRTAVMVCYQMALLTFVCSLVRIPFVASIFAREHMNWYAGVSLVECLLRLLAAVLIAYTAADALIFYSCAYGVVSVVILAVYVVYCLLNYNTCKWVKTDNKKLAWEIFNFSGWNFFSAVSKVGMIQGTIVLLNIFFGPVTTAAFAVATQLQNAFSSFSNAIVLAIRPAMIRSYAEENFEYLGNLFFVANKSLFYLLLIVALPIILEMRTILSLWLGYITDEMASFCRLMVVYAAVLAMNNPITVIIHATGNVKRYTIAVETITLLCLPVSWMLFKNGVSACWAMYSMIALCMAAHVQRLVCLKRECAVISLRRYCLSFVLTAAGITLLSCLLSLLIHSCSGDIYMKIALWIICFPIAECALFYFAGLNKGERNVVKGIIRLRRQGT